METKITTNFGTSDDIEAIAQFQVAMAQETENLDLTYEKVLPGVTAAMNDKAKGQYLVAKTDGKTIGSLMITREWSDWNNEWYWWIQSVYVMPEYRGKGVYRKMYQAVKETAKAHNIPQVRLYVERTNTRAQQVYSRLGMHESHYLLYEEILET